MVHTLSLPLHKEGEIDFSARGLLWHTVEDALNVECALIVLRQVLEGFLVRKIDCAAMIPRIRKGNHLNKNLHRRCKSTRTDQPHVSDRIHSIDGWCGVGSMS